jgi:hypothetical protein
MPIISAVLAATPVSSPVRPDSAFARVCDQLALVLDGSFRRDLAAEVSSAKAMGPALLRLRDRLRANVFRRADDPNILDKTIRRFDSLTRQDGFHVLHDWDGIADRVNEDTIPVDVLHYIAKHCATDPPEPGAAFVLLDYHFMHLLALLTLRIWDEGDPDANLDRVSELLALLQGPDGSGQLFAHDAETLLLIGTSHFELHEWGYGKLLTKVRTLNDAHKIRIAIGHASSMGSHLRFGFEATYGRDTVNMRDDNVADYPWLCFALATVMQEYVRSKEAGRDDEQQSRIVEALLNGLSADANAFTRRPPPSLSTCEDERARFAEQFHAHQAELMAQFEPLRPSERVYSPLSFFFNFSHNVLKGAVVDALLAGRPWALTLDDLLTGVGDDEPKAAMKMELARTLMGYARANPHRIRGRLTPVIVYDPQAGRQAYSVTMQRLRE